ncbi:MAG: hypothetical protein FD133_1901 [Erysipelotrichaceae bacterium]|nr:MAG: hypothetical protein FD133_1901 [Erysipelotrichaceae bacterium]
MNKGDNEGNSEIEVLILFLNNLGGRPDWDPSIVRIEEGS